jgi:ParB-like chromosome segregation protein Spo0J
MSDKVVIEGKRAVESEPRLADPARPDGLAIWTHEGLKASIRRFGVILPVVKDECGNIIDGRRRVAACLELGVRDYPVITLRGLTEEEKRDCRLVLNHVRTHLTRRQMRELIAAELRNTPDLSGNWLAQILGTTDKTVEAVRQRLIATSEIPKFERHRGRDGKSRKVTRITTHTAACAERAQRVLKALGDEAPAGALELRLAERRSNRKTKLDLTKGKQVRRPGEGEVRLHHCPFQRLEEVAGIMPGSVNLILTDIPYGRDFLPQVEDLGAFAERVLVPGGLFVTYCGNLYFNKVIRSLDGHLNWAWPVSSVWRGDASINHHRNVVSQWKPIVVYSKGEWKQRGMWPDLLLVESKEKDWPRWQQPLEEFERLLRYFSEPDDLVVDPCGGGFTTAVACKRLGRRCISCDTDEAAVIRGQERLDTASEQTANVG